jgi:hypothetical protein
MIESAVPAQVLAALVLRTKIKHAKTTNDAKVAEGEVHALLTHNGSGMREFVLRGWNPGSNVVATAGHTQGKDWPLGVGAGGGGADAGRKHG